MAGKGSQPGEHRGGRAKGKKNRATEERELLAGEIIKQAKAQGASQAERDALGMLVQLKAAESRKNRKLAKDVLDDLMHVGMGLVGKYQPRDGNETQNEAKFENWLKITAQIADRLAEYQSPKYRAIAVVATPDQQQLPAPKTIEGTTGGDRTRAAQQTYLRLVKG